MVKYAPSAHNPYYLYLHIIIYLFCALGWASGLYVLFRNERAQGADHYSESCAGFERILGHSVSRTLLYLVEVTLSGANFWACAAESEYHVRARRCSAHAWRTTPK